MANPDRTQEPIMFTAISDDMKSLMSDFGVSLADLNSTDLLVELVIDTFDHWRNPTDAVTGPTGVSITTLDFDVPALVH